MPRSTLKCFGAKLLYEYPSYCIALLYLSMDNRKGLRKESFVHISRFALSVLDLSHDRSLIEERIQRVKEIGITLC